MVSHGHHVVVIAFRPMELGENMELKQGAEIIPLPLEKGRTGLAILALVKKRVDEKIEFLLSGLALNIADALFEEMNHLDEQQALNHHFNIMRAMKIGHEVYQIEFSDLMNETWLGFLNKMDESHIRIPEGEVAGKIEDYAARLTSHYKVLSQETRNRLQTLLGREVSRHPLCPELFYCCFWQALSELSLSYEERSYVLTLFHRFVMDRYGQILGLANRTLIELKVDVA